jgi:sulfopyruvate decarboxylase subunit beta
MQRVDVLRSIYSDLADDVVVTIMGAVAAELYSLGHRRNFFYLQHSMGLASSMGLGLALSRPEKRVVVFDGDGSLLMNLGTLSTLAWYAPSNMIHVVFDNESLLSVGGFPTATSVRTDLAGIAKDSGIGNATTTRTLEEFKTAWNIARQRRELSFIVAKVEAVGPKTFLMDLPLLENRFQFQRWLLGGKDAGT